MARMHLKESDSVDIFPYELLHSHSRMIHWKGEIEKEEPALEKRFAPNHITVLTLLYSQQQIMLITNPLDSQTSAVL